MEGKARIELGAQRQVLEERDATLRGFFASEIQESRDDLISQDYRQERKILETLYKKNPELAAYRFFEMRMLQGRKGWLQEYRTITPEDFTNDLKAAILDMLASIFEAPIQETTE